MVHHRGPSSRGCLQAFVGRDEPGALVLGFESGCGATPMVDIALGQVCRRAVPQRTGHAGVKRARA